MQGLEKEQYGVEHIFCVQVLIQYHIISQSIVRSDTTSSGLILKVSSEYFLGMTPNQYL